ncbi:cation diffusion facilitator family transporter [Gloeothece citriformis PCC 7424]|uniref:Cation diffusion facilitator family transporter n=1 Tax=Gloeothece citriformis (strain PCC 7424) TaxID=65393 RepID=B7KK82_GLOC7|nr:cation diffusion facilitator family transporter [Gloeothece citriformis]ACK70967.1 cation diffusion facilitator family transporter [Gloeothece citriformis PCC 7424]
MSLHHNHNHNHNHDHNHHAPNFNRAFIIGTILNVGFVVIEAGFGFLTNSLALLADAGHNFSDVLGLLLAWGASWLTSRRPTARYTYGFRRSSIFAALINGILLFVALIFITIEAVQRLANPVPISEMTIIIVALIGVVINTITALLFMSGRKGDLNIRGAFLHMAADALISVGVVLAGIAMMVTGWLWFDPVVSLIIVVVIAVGTWNLLQESVNLALDAVPTGINPQAVRTYLRELPGVMAVHDLHIWAMSTTEPVLTVHLVMPEGNPGDEFLSRINEELDHNFGIEHTTIQIESDHLNSSCSQRFCCD